MKKGVRAIQEREVKVSFRIGRFLQQLSEAPRVAIVPSAAIPVRMNVRETQLLEISGQLLNPIPVVEEMERSVAPQFPGELESRRPNPYADLGDSRLRVPLENPVENHQRLHTRGGYRFVAWIFLALKHRLRNWPW